MHCKYQFKVRLSDTASTQLRDLPSALLLHDFNRPGGPVQSRPLSFEIMVTR